MPRKLAVRAESWPIAGSFRIARGAKTEARVVIAEIADGSILARGECVPYARYGESPESVVAALAALAGGAGGLELSERALARGSTRENPAQVLGVFRLPRRSLAGVTLGAAPLVLVLLGLEKPGNLGAILRAADGAGADLVLGAEGGDLFSPQVIRNSTGAVFEIGRAHV